MRKSIKLKIILTLIAILLGGWNFFLRKSLSLPVLSGLSPRVVWIIAGVFLAVVIIMNWTEKNQYG